MRVLHIIKSLGRGGAEMLLPETLKLHNKTGFEFHYIYFLPWKNQLEKPIKDAGGRVTCLSASNNIQIIIRYKEIIRYIKANKIQVIHCHLPWAGFVGRLIKYATQLPVLYTEHNKQERYHPLTFWLNKMSFNWQDVAVAVSEDVAESIKKNIQPSIPVSVIKNGVNTDSFVRDKDLGSRLKTELGIPPEAVVVGVVCVFRSQKRLPEWIEIFTEVSKKNDRIFAVIVGDGPLKAEVEAKTRQSGASERIKLAGLQTDVKPWFSVMDVYMMSSLFEGLPVAMLEAMSMGCAIVSTDAGGIREVVRNDLDGFLVPVDNYKALAIPLERVCSDQQLRRDLGIAARKRVEESFSLRKMVFELESLYREFANRG